jgi:5-methylcytosine-specific restriction endonuclease McrBC regulatory subunit McrC
MGPDAAPETNLATESPNPAELSEEAADTPGRWSRLADLIGEENRDIGVTVEWDGPGAPVLRASGKVGHLTLTDPETGTATQVTIHPKVKGSVSGMLRAAVQLGRTETPAFEKRPTAQEERPSAWLAALYAERLEAFLTRIRSRGVERTEELNGRIRGRPLVSRYLKENYWTSRARIPCRYVEWTEDNLPNRILRHAVTVGRQAVSPYGSDGKTTLGQLRRCEGHLASVEHVRIQPGDFQRVRPMLKGSFRAYEPIVELAELLITAVDPFDRLGEIEQRLPAVRAFESGESPDGNLRWDLVDMPTLFEEYVRTVTGGTRANASYSISLQGKLPASLQGLKGKSLELDREPLQVGGSLVLDAKYMSVGRSRGGRQSHRSEDGRIHLSEYEALDLRSETPEVEKEETLRQVKNSHLYQVLAYATHRHTRADRAALVYPVVGGEEKSGDEAPGYHGLGFRSGVEIGGVPIHVLTVRIDEDGIGEEMRGNRLERQVQRLLSESDA